MTVRAWAAVVALAACSLLVGPGTAATAQVEGRGRYLPDTYRVSGSPGVLPEGHRHRRARPDARRVGRDRHPVPRAGPRPADAPVRPGSGRQAQHARGAHRPRGQVWSVGADTLTVHTPEGRLLARRTAPAGPLGGADLNDLALTPEAVYVTDWANPVVYRASIHHGRPGPLRPWVDLRGALPGFPAQYWLLNGIVADRTGATVLVASNGTEMLWRLDVANRTVEPVDLGGHSFGADGMVLAGRRLYAVLNHGAPAGVYLADLDAGLRRGTVVTAILTDADHRPFDLPTTLARYGCRLYVVNSQNSHPPGVPPYTVSAVADPSCPAMGWHTRRAGNGPDARPVG